MAEKTLLQGIREALGEEMERDERVWVLGEDVGKKGGVFLVTEGLYDRFGEARVLDTPLAESSIVGVAIGAAMNGTLPVAEIQFADFIHPAFDQIVSEAARIRYRSNGDFSCPLVIRAPFGGGVHGGLYHSQSVEAYYAHVPGLKVVIPSTPEDAKGLLKSSIRDPDPVMCCEHKKTYRLIKGEVPDGDCAPPLGRAAGRREGASLSCFAWGLMAHYCMQSAEELEADGVSVEVIDLRTLKPLDKETILASVRKTARALVVYEDNLTGGFGAEVAAIIAQEAFEHLDAPVVRVAAPDVPAMPFNKPQEDAFMPSPERIAAELRKLAAVGPSIIRALRSQKSPLLVPVVAYMLVFAVMLTLAFGTTRKLIIAGALLFALSDALLGYYQFARPLSWGRNANIVLYQAGQAGLALSLAL